MSQKNKIIILGVPLKERSFNGANKATLCLGSALVNQLDALNEGRVENNKITENDIIIVDLDSPAKSFEKDVKPHLKDAAIISFSGVLSPQLNDFIELANQTRKELRRAENAEAPIVVGGYAVKDAYTLIPLVPAVSGWIDGEGEENFPKIVKASLDGTFDAQRKTGELVGVASRNGATDIHLPADIGEVGSIYNPHVIMPLTREPARVMNFDAINQNYRHEHVPEKHNMTIFRDPETGRQLKTAQIFTQRGCPWQCGFCNKSEESGLVPFLGEASFRRQLKELKAQGYEAVYLDVDTFTANPNEAKRQAQILKDEGFYWGSNTRIDKITPELLQFFRDNNCQYMFFGVEHTNPAVLAAVGKFETEAPRFNLGKDGTNYDSIAAQYAIAQTYKDMVTTIFRSMESVAFEVQLDKLYKQLNPPTIDERMRSSLLQVIPVDEIYPVIPENILTDKEALQDFVARRHGKDTKSVQAFLDSFQNGLPEENPLKNYKSVEGMGLPSSYFIILGLPKVKLDEKGQIAKDVKGNAAFEPTTIEDDKKVIAHAISECNVDYLNFNVLRFMPGSKGARQVGESGNPYACVRPTGAEPVTAAHFTHIGRTHYGIEQQKYHPVFRLCESVGPEQPFSTAMTPERVYKTYAYAIELINAKILNGGKKTELFIDTEILEKGLVTQDQETGIYTMAALDEFEYKMGKWGAMVENEPKRRMGGNSR